MQTFLTALLVFLVLAPMFVYIYQKQAMDYYKNYGRKPEEIRNWLVGRKWYSVFKTNLLKELEDGALSAEDVDDIIAGKRDKMTIGAAFAWNATPEGTKYWGKREYQFLKWYYGQWVDFHMFK